MSAGYLAIQGIFFRARGILKYTQMFPNALHEKFAWLSGGEAVSNIYKGVPFVHDSDTPNLSFLLLHQISDATIFSDGDCALDFVYICAQAPTKKKYTFVHRVVSACELGVELVGVGIFDLLGFWARFIGCLCTKT